VARKCGRGQVRARAPPLQRRPQGTTPAWCLAAYVKHAHCAAATEGAAARRRMLKSRT